MGIRMNIHEKFELSDGMTVLACSGYEPEFHVIGKQLGLIFGDEVRQTLTISGERKMLNQKENITQRAFESHDTIQLTPEEARSGNWQLIGD